MAATRAAARAVAAALRPLRTRWRAYWDVDHRAPNFASTDAEFEAEVAADTERWNEAVRGVAMRHMRTEVLPRMRVDLSKGLGGVSLSPRLEPGRHNLYEKCVLSWGGRRGAARHGARHGGRAL
jgi:hypothetical protein